MKTATVTSLSVGMLVGIVMTAGIMRIEQPQARAAEQPPKFDHSNCQYPERWTNPANGCDNSDPAVPECIKSAWSEESERACIELVTGQYAEKTEVETPKTSTSNPNLNENSNVAKCTEGK